MTTVFALVIMKCILVLLMLHASYGRSVPNSSENVDRGRTLHPCPSHCICFNHTVTCNSVQLSTVPRDLPARTKLLFLNDNMIESLDWQILSKLKKLEELHLESNKLSKVHWKDFDLLPSLKLLDLSDNPIVCDCNIARLMNREEEGTTRLHVRLGETRCASPEQHAGGRARDILSGLDCRYRRRRYEKDECHDFCHNGGTCHMTDGRPVCHCPDSFEGGRCESQPQLHGSWSDDDALTIHLVELTPTKIKVSWLIEHGMSVDKYSISLDSQDPHNNLAPIYTTQTHFTFGALRPATRYEVCVAAYSDRSEESIKSCEVYQTHPLPPDTGGPPSPDQSPGPHGNFKDDDDEIIHQAAVILGSIIGVCAFFVIFLTLIYKFRTLRNNQTQRSISPTPPVNTETEISRDTTDNATNPSREIIVLSVSAPENSTGSPADEVDASASEAAASTPDSVAINSVLQALKQHGSRNAECLGPGNTVVLYRSENSASGEGSASSQDNPSGSAPIFIVADGNHYPLDPALSQVLRSAMAGANAQRHPVPDEPPPPYSERAEEDEVTPPLVHDESDIGYIPTENSEDDVASLVQRQEDRS